MSIIRVAGVPCSRCGERTWYRREPEEKRVTRGTLLAVALFPVRILDLSLGYLTRGRGTAVGRYNRELRESLRAQALQPDRVKGVEVPPGQMVCASCGYTYLIDADPT